MSRSSKSSSSSKKPPLPFGTSSIGRSYSTLNRFLLNDILSPNSRTSASASTSASVSVSASNQLEVPDASTTYRSSHASYRSPSTTSMLFGTMTSTRKRSSAYDKIKSSSPISASSSFRRSSDKYSTSGYREETTSLTIRFTTSTSLLSASTDSGGTAGMLSPGMSNGRGRGRSEWCFAVSWF